MSITGVKYFSDTGNTNSFDGIGIKIASPDKIRAWSYGEVISPDTVNYRTIKPENDGLFCARIFGPIRDYECLCGKYKRVKYKNIVCEKCGVEVTLSRTRRYRMGHIELAAPVVHVWFLRSLPSKISVLLDLSLKDIEKVLYFEANIVINPGTSRLQRGELLSDDELYEAQDKYGEDSFEAAIGALAIQKMLKQLNIPDEIAYLRTSLAETTSETKKKRLVKRLKMLEEFKESGNDPSWMVLDVLPVLPPDIRPLVMLDGGRFATSDLNELYRRVINRNNRLKRLLELNAPEIIVRNEKRMLQEAVDALFDNSRKGRVKSNKRPLRSLSDMLKGKQGRFRQNLLGKRVDYSGRSVIVVGPELKLHQCGLPKQMALELFKPFIYSKLELYGHATTLKAAKKMVEAAKPEVWDILAEVIKEHPVLLNRAPTLHRLGIQAFEPVLIEGKAIQLHPLVCAAFNADFDGDQMAVHIPLSLEAQLEARVLMMSTNNILSPANGRPIIVPTQDMVLGLYYMTVMDEEDENIDSASFIASRHFDDILEVKHALNSGVLKLQSKIYFHRQEENADGNMISRIYEITPGRLLVAELLPSTVKTYDVINKVLNKKEVEKMIDFVYRSSDQKSTVLFADRIMQLGFSTACKSGISFGKKDMIVPSTKKKYLDEASKKLIEYNDQYAEGLITIGERYNKLIDGWTICAELVAKEMMKVIGAGKGDSKKTNNIYIMVDSGARGSVAQTRQICGMRGLMATPSGKIIETPVKSNFKEGLTPHEYFISTHGARKGLADTALKTANSGYLTRKLVDVSQDLVIVEEDCGVEDGMVYKAVIEEGDIAVKLSEIVLGRVSVNDVYHPHTGELLISAGQLIVEEEASKLDDAGIESIKVRSVLICESKNGICSKCYGRDLATGHLVDIGEAVGVIAAQSIGEPGTQLTMRTFHIGGVVQKSALQSNLVTQYDGQVKIYNENAVEVSGNKYRIVMSRGCEVGLVDAKGHEKLRYKLPYGAKLFVKNGDEVVKSTLLAEWDPYTLPIITEKSGKVVFKDFVDNISVREIYDETTGTSSKVVTDWRRTGKGSELKPRIVLQDENGEVVLLSNGLPARYFLPAKAILSVGDGQWVNAGDIVARIPKETVHTKDITGGLPRVVELFEARKPKDHSVISEINGVVEFGKDYKSKRKLIIRPFSKDERPVEYLIPRGRHITVNEGDYVSKGDTLMEGNPSLNDILRIMGVEELARYMVNEVQQVYRLQGVKIDDKHIEVVLRQMLQKVEIIDSGDTTMIVGEQIDVVEFTEINNKVVEEGLRPATARIVLQGITRASLKTRSFFSAASFQQTTMVLTEAAVAGKKDMLMGLKENIIVGRLIPAGTGFCAESMKSMAKSRDIDHAPEEVQA